MENGCRLHMLVEQLANGEWRAHAHCTNEAVTARLSPVETEQVALEGLVTWFRQTFPEHSCQRMKCQTLG